MKKTILFSLAIVAMMVLSCQNEGKGDQENAAKENQTTEASVKQVVEQMMQMDVANDMDKLLTADMLAMQQKTLGVHFEGDYFMGFQWNTGVFDVCSEDFETKIEGVKLIDSLHSDVAMRYVDPGCYDEPYTLHLLKEDGQWKIDDVEYQESTLREQCKLFYEEVAEWYRTASPETILDLFMTEEPSEENYSNPNTIYFNNPMAVQKLISEICNNHELFKQNPGYTEVMGAQIEAMVSRIKTHL